MVTLLISVTWMDGKKAMYEVTSFVSEGCQWKLTRANDTVILNRGNVREIVISQE